MNGYGMRGLVAVVLLTAVTVAPGCGVSTRSSAGVRGQTIEVLAVWSGAEQAAFSRVLDGFHESTGASVRYTSAPTGVPQALAARVSSHEPPDVAILPQPGLLQEYAQRGLLVPLDAVVGSEVARNYGPVWRRLASTAGHVYGVWFKAANKSLVWYNIAAFERTGVVPPADVDGLLTVARTLEAAGLTPFAVGGKDAWTLTDWFENLYLRSAGPADYDLLAEHRLPWTDASVKATLRLLSQVLAPAFIAGGNDGAAATTFHGSVDTVFSPSSVTAMTAEGDFVAGVIADETKAVLGVDADVFPFPAVGRSGPAVVGGGDIAVLLRKSAAGEAFLRYLATPAAAALWASRGGFISPNVNLDLSVYPDDITRSMARQLLEAGDLFRFDLSDLQPPAFGAIPDAGMRRELRAFLINRDVDATSARLEAAATAAWGR